MKEQIKKIKSFIQTVFLLFRKKIKGIFQFKLSGITLPKIKFNQKSFVASLPIILAITAGVAGISYGVVEYKKTSGLVREADQFTKEEKYGEAIGKLNLAQVSWFVDNLGIQKEKISSEIEKNKKLDEDKSKYNQGIDELNNGNLEEAINLLSELPENSFYYQKSQTKIEEAKRKILEEELGETKIAKKEAEEKAQQEAIKRSQEEMVRKAKEQELATKEAQEKMMNTDNDGDGLTYRRELELGTSDWNTDSDGDGINDGEDLHPAGGGRNLAQNFEWKYEGTTWNYTLSIHEDWYEYYKNKPRSPHGTTYVTYNDKFIKAISNQLKEKAEKMGYHKSSFIVSFIQSLPYVEDYYTAFDEYPKYPVETIIDRNGDCEDTSYLFASIVEATGIGTALVEFHNHMGVGIKTAHSQSGYYYPIGEEWYYYYETTGKGWEVGDLPKDYLYEKAKITRIWDGSVNYLHPQYIKPCYSSPDLLGYYSDGKNFYSDSQCNNLTYCLLYKEFYYNPSTQSFYHDSSCSQIVVKGCYKSKSYSGYFYKSGTAWYYDSQCTQLYKSMSCIYPSSLGYSCTQEYQYTSKQSSCGRIRALCSSSGTLGSPMCGYAACLEELDKCRNDINEYQSKLNEYNQCWDKKEY